MKTHPTPHQHLDAGTSFSAAEAWLVLVWSALGAAAVLF
jgi:hypothetical protein